MVMSVPIARRASAITLVVFSMLCAPGNTARSDEGRAAGVDFTRDVQPIFQARCLDCHGPTRPRGGLRLDSLEGTLRGGGSGPIVEPGNAADSLLVHHIAGLEGASRMPPKGDALTSTEIGSVRAWIDRLKSSDIAASGGPSDLATLSTPAWPWTALVRPGPPAVEGEHSSWVRNPIDAFVLRALIDRGLRPSPEADRRTLLRRLSLDLTGLTPTPEELASFELDSSPDAYEKRVDRLLASPRHGERWARRWLDVAHYADSHGQDEDAPRPNAWPYRDYLIRSFNADKPYARFVREQVAGDAMYPDDPDAIVATGFLAAGPWDESGLMGIAEQSIDRQIAHYLDRDDMVTTTMSTFAAVTAGCARCHDHKFDPITQKDYYALQAVFAGIDKAERGYDADPAIARLRANLTRRETEARDATAEPGSVLLSAELQARVGAFEHEHRKTESSWSTPAPITCRSDKGSQLRTLLDRSVLSIGPRPDRDTYTISVASDLPSITGLRLEVLSDETLPRGGPGRNDNGNFHLSEVRVFARPLGTDGPGVLVPIRSAVADFNQEGWGIDRAHDGDPATAWGIFPAVGISHRAVFAFENPVRFLEGVELTVHLDQLHGGTHLIGRFRLSLTAAARPLDDASSPLPDGMAKLIAVPPELRTPSRRAEMARLVWLRDLERERAELPPLARVYCGTNRFEAAGTFRPATTPRPVFVLARGEITRPGDRAEPGALAAVSALPSRFDLTDPNDEGARRAALASWLTDRANPLTWRAIANRAWHDHFGRGLVDTPNDLGAMGGAPSHPELLDWLAAEMRDGPGTLKHLHRLMVTSATYRQSARHDPEAAALDADNRLLWRFNRARMDAESVRDSVLQASGRLDLTMYGPPVMHFRMSPGVHVTPVADYDDLDLDRPEARRRAIYRYVFRTRPDPFLQAIDCPDASQSAPVRTVSLGPLQALALWNNRFMLTSAEHLADRATRAASTLEDRVAFVSRQVLLRAPDDEERRAWALHAERHGLANLARVLFNSSEFLFID
jgi:mono/diheme cytochrome c family protein